MIPWQYRLAGAVTLAASLAVWWHFRPHPAPVSTPVIAQPARAVATVGKEMIQAKVKVYKPEAKKRLKLPQNVTSDPAKHVAASSTIKPDNHPHTVSTVIDDKTGEVTTYDVREPLPWLAVDSHGEAGMGYGMKFTPGKGFGPVARIVARQNLVDIKAATVSLQGTLDGDGEAYAGVFVTARW
ncbi:MAG TPA: hypothetical protein VLM42_03150 [Bryobacteraceae bacterium]|nr:hypothetical protein [Bryobacteraceae bacterium]